MSEIQNEIDALVRTFVAQLTVLFAQGARAAFERAMRGPSNEVRAEATPAQTPTAPARKRRRRAAKPKAAAPATKPKAAPHAQPKSAAPAKPPRTDVAPQNLPDYLAANPGQRMDQLSKSLGIPVPKLQTAMASLMASGAVRREGERRGIRYYVVTT